MVLVGNGKAICCKCTTKAKCWSEVTLSKAVTSNYNLGLVSSLVLFRSKQLYLTRNQDFRVWGGSVCRHKHPSPNLQHPCKMSGTVCTLTVPMPGLLVTQPSWIGEFQDHWKTLSQKIKYKAIKVEAHCHPWSLHMDTHTYTHIQRN